MKNLITILLLLISTITYSQTKYYTTDGKNRMTEPEVEKMLAERVDKMSKILDKKLYGRLTVEETEIKKDSIISKVIFVINETKKINLTNAGLLSQYKNKEFPKFELNTLANESFSSGELKGKPTMINFWFTKCKPCIDEMPVLNKVVEKYKDDFNFIAITYENNKDVENFLKEHPFNFKQLVDAKKFTDFLGLKSYPVNLFLDEKGIVRYIKRGIPYEGLEDGKLKMGEGKKIIEIIEKLRQQ